MIVSGPFSHVNEIKLYFTQCIVISIYLYDKYRLYFIKDRIMEFSQVKDLFMATFMCTFVNKHDTDYQNIVNFVSVNRHEPEFSFPAACAFDVPQF